MSTTEKKITDLETSLQSLLTILDEIAAEGTARVYAKDRKQMDKARKLLTKETKP